jgi:L-ascorbate metabolism protein UlaG (beta-lactamase superfamily)
MRLRLGRPSLSDHAGLFTVPKAPPGQLSVTFLGVATLLVSDAQSAVLTDGFFSRPGLAQTALQPLVPDRERIDAALSRAGITRLDAVIPVHTHYDHALDSATVAERTGAPLVGGRSAASLGQAHGLPNQQVIVAEPGRTMTLGGFDVTLVAGSHCPPDRAPGEITDPPSLPARVTAYRCGDAWSLVLRHRPTGKSLLIVGSAGSVPRALEGWYADVAYLGVGQLGIQSEDYIVGYWNETVRRVGAQRVVLIHWDDFFQSLDRALRPLPRRFDDLDRTVQILTTLANQDGIPLHLPSVWERADPWA